MLDREKVIWGLKACNRQSYNGSDCQNCPYYDDEDTAELPFGICNIQDMFDDALALLKEQELEIKGLRKLVEWAVECDFGYDNLGDWWVDRFKSEIEGMSYTEGLIHLAKRYVEVFEGGDGNA